MDKRTRILAIAFGAMLAVWGGWYTVYEWWIRPLVYMDDEIARLKQERDEAAEFDTKFQRARWDYEKLVSRVGTTAIGTLKGNLHQRIEELAHDHDLAELKVVPKLPQRYGKTECWMVSYSVSGQQKLANILAFMKDVYELPHLMRIVDPKLVPILPPRDKKAEDLVKVQLDVQALLLPARPRPRLDYVVNRKELAPQPETHIRHSGADVLTLAERKPFLEYEPKKATPLPEDRVVKTPGPPAEKPVKCTPWKGNWKLIAISRMHEPLLERVLAQDGTKTTNQKYIAPGEEFDGGLLDSVTTLAALVRYDDGIYVYPLGEEFKHRIKAEEADRYPELKERAATLTPLTQEEIKSLSGRTGRSVSASAASPSSKSPPRGAPTSSRGASSPGTNGASNSPGRLSTPSRSGPTSGVRPGSSLPPRTSPPSRSEPQPADESPPQSEDAARQMPESESDGSEGKPAQPPPPGPPDNF